MLREITRKRLMSMLEDHVGPRASPLLMGRLRSVVQELDSEPRARITSYNVCYTKLLRKFHDADADEQVVGHDRHEHDERCERVVLTEATPVITSYSIHYTKLYERDRGRLLRRSAHDPADGARNRPGGHRDRELRGSPGRRCGDGEDAQGGRQLGGAVRLRERISRARREGHN